MWEQVVLKQILLITDGCSNIGVNPVEVAKTSGGYGIAVNVIGIVDGNFLGDTGKREVQEIAAAGCGTHRIVELQQLAQTMQMMTRNTMQLTIQKVVNQELHSLVGKEMHELPPEKRVEVAHMIDQAGEEAELRLLLLLDVSASMRHKLPQVREAIQDLELGIKSRKGKYETAVMIYPDQRQGAKLIADFSEMPRLTSIGRELTAAGGTPTGPALQQAIDWFAYGKENHDGRAQNFVV